MPRNRTVVTGTLCALVAASLFGMLGPLARIGAEAGVDGVAFTAWRATLGVAFLGVLILVRGMAGPSIASVRALPGRQRRALATAAVMAIALNVSMFTAFGLVSIALALMLFYTYPAGVVVVDLVLGRERMSVTRLVALLLSFGGVVLVLFGGLTRAGGPVAPLGVVLALAAAASQVVFVTVSRGGYASVPAPAATLLILASSAVGASVIAVVAGQASSLVAPFRSVDPWLVIVIAGVAAAGISSLLFLTAIRRIGGTRTGILMLFEPVVGVVLAAVLLNEALTPIQVLGGGLVLAGAFVLQLRSAPEREPIAETDAGPVI